MKVLIVIAALTVVFLAAYTLRRWRGMSHGIPAEGEEATRVTLNEQPGMGNLDSREWHRSHRYQQPGHPPLH
ncbi:MAG: hypothetical protein AB2A00_08440 [Myxococcota bacterium]